MPAAGSQKQQRLASRLPSTSVLLSFRIFSEYLIKPSKQASHRQEFFPFSFLSFFLLSIVNKLQRNPRYIFGQNETRAMLDDTANQREKKKKTQK